MALSYSTWNVKNNEIIIIVKKTAANFGRDTPTTSTQSLCCAKDGAESKGPTGLIAVLINHLKWNNFINELIDFVLVLFSTFLWVFAVCAVYSMQRARQSQVENGCKLNNKTERKKTRMRAKKRIIVRMIS